MTMSKVVFIRSRYCFCWQCRQETEKAEGAAKGKEEGRGTPKEVVMSSRRCLWVRGTRQNGGGLGKDGSGFNLCAEAEEFLEGL